MSLYLNLSCLGQSKGFVKSLIFIDIKFFYRCRSSTFVEIINN